MKKKIEFRKVAEAIGKGTFSFDTFEKEASFRLEEYIGTETIIFMEESFFSQFNSKLLNLHNKKQIEASLSGDLNNGLKIYIDKMDIINTAGLKAGKSTPIKFKVFSPIIISNESLKPVKGKTEIHYYITNFKFTGCEITTLPKGGFISDHFSVNLEGYIFDIRKIENYKEIIEQLRKDKSKSITAKIIVRTDLKNKDKIRPIITNICKLLSFATGNSIVPIIEEHLSKGKVIWKKQTSMRVDNFMSGNQLIPDLPPTTIREFLIKAYTNYTEFKEKLGLDILLNYYLLMKSNPILDARCLFGFILLECLSNHAQEFYLKEGKPIESSMKKSKINKLDKILPKSNNLSKKIKDRIIQEFVYPFPSLQDSIKRLMDEFGMKYKKSEADIWKLRKEFIHKGMYPKNTRNHVQIYRDIVHFIDRLLLSILNYDGEFLNISNGYKTEKLIFSQQKII